MTRGTIKDFASLFKIFTGNLSGPVAVVSSRAFNCFSTDCSVLSNLRGCCGEEWSVVSMDCGVLSNLGGGCGEGRGVSYRRQLTMFGLLLVGGNPGRNMLSRWKCKGATLKCIDHSTNQRRSSVGVLLSPPGIKSEPEYPETWD